MTYLFTILAAFAFGLVTGYYIRRRGYVAQAQASVAREVADSAGKVAEAIKKL